jgi:hypothetical protein
MKIIYVVYRLDKDGISANILAFYSEKSALEYCIDKSDANKDIHYFYSKLNIVD